MGILGGSVVAELLLLLLLAGVVGAVVASAVPAVLLSMLPGTGGEGDGISTSKKIIVANELLRGKDLTYQFRSPPRRKLSKSLQLKFVSPPSWDGFCLELEA